MKIKHTLIAQIAAFAAVAGALCLRAAAFEPASPADLQKFRAATGGDEVRKIANSDGTYDIVHIFTNTAEPTNLTVPLLNSIVPGSARILVVGGGGAGSGNCGGGGGAGGLIYKDGLSIGHGTYAVTVGAGGVCSTANSTGTNGDDSVLNLGSQEYRAIGGGAGGRYGANNAQSGGSGGGACAGGSVGVGQQPNSVSGGYGNQGGRGSGNDRGGGGGGAGSAGSDASGSSGGNGGAGLELAISGENKFYAAGGGGGNANGGAIGIGGSGIGGSGVVGIDSTGTPGLDGTGSGGGGGSGGGNGKSYGGAGGSGVVIVRYTVKLVDVLASVEGLPVAGAANETYYSFTDTSAAQAFLLEKYAKVDILVVGGGGAGANAGNPGTSLGAAGGGGAGEMLEKNNITLAAGEYLITVGKGGVNSGTTRGNGADGNPSKIAIVDSGTIVYQAFGGGGGGMSGAGRSGGSGGGGSCISSTSTAVGGVASGVGYVNAGGKGLHTQAGAGGGGAGSVGGNTTASNGAGVGGEGRASAITGESIIYAAGGGGGSHSNTAIVLGGSDGIGGSGGYGYRTLTQATSGRDGTGSGGGGSSRSGSGGAGGSGIVIIRIKEFMPEAPQDMTFEYDGSYHTIPTAQGYTIKDAEGNAVDAISAREVGEYTFTVTLDSKYDCWADGTTGEKTCVLTITKPTLCITSFYVEGWQIGMKPNAPVIVSTPKLEVGEFVLKYSSKNSDGTWADEMEDVPTAAGDYQVRLEIKESNNFEPPDTVPEPATFTLWDWDGWEKAPTSLGYHAKFEVQGYDGEAIPDAWVQVKFAEDSPLGFKYKFANDDASDLRFMDGAGKQLPFVIDSWNTGSESSIRVRIASYENGAAIYACWGELDGESAPEKPIVEGAGSAEGRALQPTTPMMTKMGPVFKNRWLVMPTISKTEWREGESEGVVVTPGETVYGSAYWGFKPLAGALIANTIPQDAGQYVFLGCVDAGSEGNGAKAWSALYTSITSVVISASSPYRDLSGISGNSTLSGRVLLANDYDDGNSKVVGQAYWNTSLENSIGGVYWVHMGESDTVMGRGNIKTENRHELLLSTSLPEVCFTERLWDFTNIRLGNFFRSTGKLNDADVYLPYSPYANPSLDPAAEKGAMADSVCILMRNDTDSAIYSPCYTNGIGTIYFDAVNSITGEVYKIVVEVCKETRLGKIPTDENVEYTSTEDTSIRERYGNAEWESVELLPLVKNGKTNFEALAKTNELALAINNGGTCDNFYRVCAKVDYRGPIRFRIRRATKKDGQKLDSNFILIDNIIVSYPAMRADMEPCGEYDSTKRGPEALGQALAWSVPFPSVNDTNILARGKATYTTNPGNTAADTSKFFTGVKMHYRWRYLEQEYGPWQEVGLDHKNGFKADAPLQLYNGRQGDVEFWFESFLKAPYYEYVDYSGAGVGLSNLYTENVSVVTNRANVAELPNGKFPASLGSDWFVRLREGKSNYESILLETIGANGATNEPLNMVLSSDNVWRGYLPTPNAISTGIKYRFVLHNRQEPNAETLATNSVIWCATSAYDTLRVTEIMKVADSDEEWQTVPCDGVTGYILFQVDDRTRALTIVHADYQNFNTWHDAVGSTNKVVFVGTSIYDSDPDKAGASPKVREYAETFDSWRNMSSTSTLWSESFSPGNTALEAGIYVPFSSVVPPSVSIMTPNGWFAGFGMYVYGLYKNGSNEEGATVLSAGTDLALQLQGNGLGYVQFTGDANDSPRGLESISFSARLAQAVNCEDIAFYDASLKSTMTNYTFLTAGAFDTEKNKSFKGNASLSLFAYYRKDKGCYEFRVEQAKANADGSYDPKGQRLSIYRWSYDAQNKFGPKLLQSKYLADFSPNNNWPECTSPTHEGYLPLFISLQNRPNETRIVAGYMLTNTTQKAVGPNFSPERVTNKNYNMICCIDSDAERLTGGTYGLLSANSLGYFAGARLYNPVSALMDQIGTDNSRNYFSNNQISFSDFTGKDYHKTVDFEEREIWIVPPGRMAVQEVSVAGASYHVLKNEIPDQSINIYTAPSGKFNWIPLGTVPCNSFGSSTPYTLDIFTNATCSVRFATGGSATDVVIDNITLKQFRGDDWKNAEAYVGDGWTRIGETNIVFSSAWVTNKAVLLSARRTTPDAPSSIRSPLFDGTAGLGLGMFSFSYANAQKNAKLVLQIATNEVTESTISGLTYSHDSAWVTYKDKDGKDVVFDFSTMSDTERKSGTFSVYLGLHGVRGAMRLVVDRELVESVKDVTDRTQFGEVYITSVLCRDEPILDSGAWWGWNLRTLGGNEDSEKRMLLTDVANTESSHGMALALNNSVSQNIVQDDIKKEIYKQHQPFVQTPTFTTNVVGEITFKARKYDLSKGDAVVALYGSESGAVDQPWKLLNQFVVSASTYETFNWKSKGENAVYRAFRLAVIGVEGVDDRFTPEPSMDEGYQPQRVLIDEILVSEAVPVRMAFRNVGAFRSKLDGTDYVPNVPSISEQPLCNESWGVQCEVFAAQLADEIDFSRAPTVRLHWFKGEYPWGYQNWKGLSGARSGELVLVEGVDSAEGTNLIYRSSMKVDDDQDKRKKSVVDMSTTSGSVVQFELEVVYYQKGGGDAPITNYLSSAGSWVKPEWYKPIDKNVGKGAFSAYNILDTVAPGWAWINEVNILGDIENYINTDKDCQYVEVAVPAEADISGWSVRILEALSLSNEVVTNTIGRFGSLKLPGKKENGESEANMVFRVLGNTLSKNSGRLKFADGTLDAVWESDVPTDNVSADGVTYGTPLAIQLVRSSGILEHEIVFVGTNKWNGTVNEASYHPTNRVNLFKRLMPTSSFVYVGDDDAGSGRSLSVLTNRGQVSNDWSRAAAMTPGRINEGQVIDPNHPTPNGSQIFIYANLDTAFGHIYQTVGDAVLTNKNQIIMIQRGSPVGTNITYTVDPWYELASVTTNGRATVATKLADPRTYQVTVGVGASNNVTVVAGAKVRSDLEKDYGLTVDNKYRNAIMNWLEEGATAKGDWKNADSEKLYDVQFRALHGTVVTNLTLTQIYWLDIDPTISNQAFVAGMASAPVTTPTLVEGYMGNTSVTNVRMGVKMYITNTTENAEAYWNGKTAYAPYTLRGLEPGSLSMNWPENVAWTSVTFKVAGILANGLTSESNPNSWVPLRWFMFGNDSFADDFTSQIEVWDPYSTQSPGYSEWYKWLQDHPDEHPPVFFKWAIDTKLKPFTVELLKEKNYYGN